MAFPERIIAVMTPLLGVSVALLSLFSCSKTEREGPPPQVVSVQKWDSQDENPTIVAISQETELRITGEGFRPTPLSLLTGGYLTNLRAYFVPETGSTVAFTGIRRYSNTELKAVFPQGGYTLGTPGWMDGTVFVEEEMGGRGPSQGRLRLSAYLPPEISGSTLSVTGGNSLQSTATTAVFVNCLTAPAWISTPWAITVTVEGAYFLSSAQVEVRPSSGTITGPMAFTAETVQVVSDTRLIARFSPGLPLNEPQASSGIPYDLRITNPDGQKRTAVAAFTLRFIQVACPPPLQVVNVTPGGAPNAPGIMSNLNSPITAQFDAALRVTPNLDLTRITNYLRILREDGVSATLLGVTAIATDTVEITAQDPQATTTRWLGSRTYTIHFLPGRGGWERSDATELSGWLTAESIWAFRTGVTPPVVNQVAPPFVYCQDRTLLYIYGSNLKPVPDLTLISPRGTSVPLKFPLYITTTEVRGYFVGNSSLCSDTGYYNLWVTNPDGGSVLYSAALYVTDTPVPKITSIAPEAITKDTPFTLNLAGEDFPPGFTVAAVRKDPVSGVLTYYPASSTGFISANAVTAYWASGLPFVNNTLNNYVIRLFVNTTTAVTIYADYSALVVYDPSGNISQVILLSERLKAPLMNHGAAVAQDALGNRYLYVVGGRTALGANPRRDVEVFSLGLFGELGNHSSLPGRQGRLQEARHSLGVFSFGSFLYAAGGVTDNTGWTNPATGATSTIERAQVLDPQRIPEAQALAAITGSGNLAPGFYSYRIAALEASTHPTNPGGETLPSPSLGIRVPSQGAVAITFAALPGATGYVIYRNLGPDMAAGNERYLETILASSACSSGTCTYTDNGMIPVDPNGLEPLPPGALSQWRPLPVTMGTARAEFSLVQYAISGTSFVLFVGGENANGVLGTYSLFAFNTTGDALTPVTTALFLEDSSTGTTSPVAGAGITIATAQNASMVPPGDVYVLVGSGRTSVNGIPVKQIVQAKVQPNGTLGTFCTSRTGGGSSPGCQSLSGSPQIEGGISFLVGGIFDFAGGGDVNGNYTNKIVDCPLNNAAPPPLRFNQCSDNGKKLTKPRAFFGYARVNGFNYVLGGATTGDQADDTIELFIR